MRIGTQLAGAGFAAVVLLAAVTLGCEDSGVFAPTDGSITLFADPSTVILDPNVPNPPRDPVTNLLIGTTTIVAQVFDKSGRPQENVDVVFSTSAGRLTRAGRTVATNAAGFAADTLSVLETDPESITVGAQSGTVTKTVTVTKTIQACTNVPPVADAGADIAVNRAATPKTSVTLNGQGSSDLETPFSDLRFLWDCGNGTTPPTQAAVVTCQYDPPTGSAAVSYTARLTVVDRGNGICDGGEQCQCQKSHQDTVTVTIR